MDAAGQEIERLIQTGAAPPDVGAIDAVLEHARSSIRPEAALRYALAFRHGVPADAAVAARVEEAIVEHAISRHEGLARLVGALAHEWPAGLGHPRILGAIRLALDVDALPGEHLVLMMPPLLATDDRVASLLPEPSRAPLLERIRAANVCRAVALSASLSGGLGSIFRDDRGSRFVEVLRALYMDPDHAVGGRAAWAAGLLREDPRIALLITGAWGSAGVTARRALVAAAARWQAGDLDDATFSKTMREGAGRSDAFARASAILGLRHGLHVDHGRAADLVASFARDSAPVVRVAVASFAEALADRALRDAIVADVRRAAGGAPNATLRLWEDHSDHVEQALAASHALRTAARASGAACEGGLLRVLASLDEVTRTARGDDEIHEALVDVSLLESSLVHDAAAASGRDDGERTDLVRRCEDAVVRAWSRRVDVFLETGAATTSVDRARGLRRVLDACPFDSGLVDGWEERSVRLTALLFERVASNPKGELARPLVAAFAASAEGLIGRGCLSRADLFGAILGVGSARDLDHLADALTGGLRVAVRALAALRRTLDRASAKGKRPIGADDLAAHLAAVATSTTAFGGPVAAAIASVLRAATTSLGPRDGSADAFGLWSHAIRLLRQAHAVACSRLVISPPSDIEQVEIDHALRSLLVRAGLAEPDGSSKPFGRARAEKRVNLVLGPAMSGLVEVALGAEHAAPETVRAPPDPVAPGKQIGDYVVVRLLGSGGMGHCVLVKRRLEEDQPNARRWVLKIPRKREYVDMFRDEALALIELSRQGHPAVARFVSFVDYGARLPFLLMDFVDGEPLDQRLGRGPLSDPDFYAVGAQLASGLGFSHERGICHHDLKTANVVLGPGGRNPVLVDWGLAGAAVPDGGTPEYMAPERFEANRKSRREAIVGAADVFALGCVLAEMRTARQLVSSTLTAHEIAEHPDLAASLQRMSPDLQRHVGCASVASNAALLTRRARYALADLPHDACHVVAACLATDPRERPRASDVARVLGARLPPVVA